jgi:hypothetical protein
MVLLFLGISVVTKKNPLILLASRAGKQAGRAAAALEGNACTVVEGERRARPSHPAGCFSLSSLSLSLSLSLSV